MKKIVLVKENLSVDSFKIDEVQVDNIINNQVLVKPIVFGLNAGMKSRICNVRDGAGTISIGDTPTSDAVVEILEVKNKSLKHIVGKKAIIQWCPWSDEVIVDYNSLIFIPDKFNKNIKLFVTILGHTGFTAWTSLKIGKVTNKDHLIVSGAAGGVGISLMQIARAKGIKVTGIASGNRVKELEKYGFNCIDRTIEKTLPKHTVFHDGVGGFWLEQSINSIEKNGRIIICGNLSGAFPKNFNRIIHKDISLLGFSVMNHQHDRLKFWNDMYNLIENNKIEPISTDFYGLTEIPKAFNEMFSNPKIGRFIVWI